MTLETSDDPVPSSHPDAAASIATLLKGDDQNVDDEREADQDEFVRYGDRLCFLCEGQLLALSRKLNLTYQQMALLFLSTVATAGAMGIASFFVWKRGLFRKRYAALSSADIYADEDEENQASTAAHGEAVDAKAVDAKAVTFRLFAYDPVTKAIAYDLIGKPVKMDEPVIVVHADTHRVMRFKSHKHCVTLKRASKHPQFQKLLWQAQEASIAEDEALARSGVSEPQPWRHSVTSSMALLSSSYSHSVSHLEQTQPSASHSTIEACLEHERPEDEEPSKKSQAQTQTPARPQRQSLYRSISESCVGLVADLGASMARQRERQRARRRQKELLKDVPNVSLDNHAGQFFLAHLRAVDSSRHSPDSQSRLRRDLAAASPDAEFLRWGAPLSLVADFNHQPCGIRSREYYQDSQLYLSTEASPTTLIPLRDDGDLRSVAKESTRTLAQLQRKQVHVCIGTYNVWMMPRKVSAFTNVSPKKNTRARLIADVLPNCDIWAFTECFDHRARAILLAKLKAAGYHYHSPTVGHKQVKRENMRKLLNGGVVIVSKYPIVSVRIKLFKAVCTGADALADKGILYCKILKDGLLLHVFASHLQAWNDPPSRAARRTQMEMLVEFMHSLAIDPVNEPVFFTGDMNIDFWLNESNGEYQEMLDLFRANDPSIQHTQHIDHDRNSLDYKRKTQFSFDKRVNPLAGDGLSSDGSLELLDYVLYSRDHRQPTSAVSWIQPVRVSTPWKWKKKKQYDLSDHFPVLSSFVFSS